MDKGGDFVQPIKFKNRYRIASTRLKNHDYSSDGFYFITICTDDRNYYFGEMGGTFGLDFSCDMRVLRDVETGLKPVSTVVGQRWDKNHCASVNHTNVNQRTGVDPYTDVVLRTNGGSHTRIYPIDPIGSVQSKICLTCWLDLPNHYPNCILDAFVIMPDHVHLVLKIDNRNLGQAKKYSASEIIRGFKTFTARKINEYQNTAGKPFWQARFYDRIIRHDDDLQRVRNYIANNPAKWERDRNNSEGIGM